MFGLECSLTGDGVEVPEIKLLRLRKWLLRTHHDHRLAMTAMILIAKGATIETPNLCKVSDLLFRERLSEFGIQPCLPKCSSMLWSDIRIAVGLP